MHQPLIPRTKGKSSKPEIPQYTGWHPLHIAAFEGDIAWTKQLIHDNAYIHAVDVYGRTALHYARRRKFGEKNDVVAKLLIENGADEYSPIDCKGRRPVDIYMEYNDEI